MVGIAAATLSERGQRARNEDSVRAGSEGAFWLAVLADGAGGHEGGAEASRRIVHRLPTALSEVAAPFDAPALTRAVVAAHRHIQAGQRQPAGRGRMHSTVVALWIDAAAGQALWSHVGDSRLYLVRRGVLRQLTSDDSVVQRMVDAGVITPRQALVHPNRAQLIAALGIDDEVDPHTLPEAVPLQAGDAFLLCSDGWWGSVTDEEIVSSLSAADTPEEWLAAMQQCIEQRGHAHQDNFSAIAAWVMP